MKNIAQILLITGCLSLIFILSGCSTPVPATVPATLPTPNTFTDSKVIALNPIAQQTEVWCWAAVSEMILRYNGLPNLNQAGNYQCGIVAAYYGPLSTCWRNCFTCISTIGGMTEIQKIVNQYGTVANNLGVPSRNLSSTLVFRNLTLQEVANDIKSNRPIIAGISPNEFALPNLSQHVTVIIGYDATGIVPMLIVNDPFPFGLPQFRGQPNPYLFLRAQQLQPGQYKISVTV
jgi:hypothetical protein